MKMSPPQCISSLEKPGTLQHVNTLSPLTDCWESNQWFRVKVIVTVLMVMLTSVRPSENEWWAFWRTRAVHSHKRMRNCVSLCDKGETLRRTLLVGQTGVAETFNKESNVVSLHSQGTHFLLLTNAWCHLPLENYPESDLWTTAQEHRWRTKDLCSFSTGDPGEGSLKVLLTSGCWAPV